jgi:hypothetical protein
VHYRGLRLRCSRPETSARAVRSCSCATRLPTGSRLSSRVRCHPSGSPAERCRVLFATSCSICGRSWRDGLVLVYFASALVVDTVFTEPFCKYLCPIGQLPPSPRRCRRSNCG